MPGSSDACAFRSATCTLTSCRTALDVWVKPRLMALYLVVAPFLKIWADPADWSGMVLNDQALPGVVATVLLTQIALVGTAFLALAFFPLVSQKF